MTVGERKEIVHWPGIYRWERGVEGVKEVEGEECADVYTAPGGGRALDIKVPSHEVASLDNQNRANTSKKRRWEQALK